METRANYVVIGSFVLVLFLALVAFVVWLGRFGGADDYQTYDVYFSGSVTGLSVGSPVSYRGITVGNVSDIEIDPDNLERIHVMLSVEEDTPIRQDTVASLQLQGITGGQFVLLTGGTENAPPLTAGPGQDNPVIPAEPSSIEQLLGGAPAIVDQVDQLLYSASELLDERNRLALAQTLQNVRNLTAGAASRSVQIVQMIDNAAAAVESLRVTSDRLAETSRTLSANVINLTAQGEQTLRTFENAGRTIDEQVVTVSADAQATLAELESLIAENRQPLQDFTNTGLYEITSLVAEFRDLTVSFDRLLTEARRDPARFLFGTQQRQGYELR